MFRNDKNNLIGKIGLFYKANDGTLTGNKRFLINIFYLRILFIIFLFERSYSFSIHGIVIVYLLIEDKFLKMLYIIGRKITKEAKTQNKHKTIFNI